MYIDNLIEIEIGEDTKHKIIITEDSNLTESFFFQLLTAGYEPKTKFQAGIKTEKK